MLSIYPDWRWGEFNKINPYPTLKIFKQKIFNNWDSLENKVYLELEKKINLKF